MIKIRVLKKHINKGEYRSSERCPIALALEDSGLKFARVSDLELQFEYKGESHSINPTNRVMTFINRFDDRLDVKPFTFNLPIRLEGKE